MSVSIKIGNDIIDDVVAMDVENANAPGEYVEFILTPPPTD